MLRSMQTRAGADQPIVFVLPGIMGSHLNIGDRAVWLRYLALLRGGLGDLADVDAVKVRPVALVGDGYRELCEFLQDSHEVIPFAYDWRRSVTDAARLLAVEVENALRRTRQPVRIVAHSMGGLVVRAMIAARPDLWDRMCERDGARLVMLGTPNRGSHDIVEALLGTAATVQQLALLDLAHDTTEIVNIVARFPGVLELLPNNGRLLRNIPMATVPDQRNGSAVPDEALLAAARQTHDSLAEHLSLFPHSDRVHYVAGTSPRTVTGVEIVHGRVVLECTTEGDGRVTHESGRLPGVRTWYIEVAHGDLAAHEPGFRALQEVLETGTTSQSVDRPTQHVPWRCSHVPRRCPSRCSIRRNRRWRPACSARLRAGRISKASRRASGYRWSTAICATRAIRSWSGITKVTPSSARRITSTSCCAARCRNAIRSVSTRASSAPWR